MIEFQINNRNYKAGNLNAFQQFHVVRRLAPALAVLGDVFKGGLAGLKEDPLKVALPLVDALSKMSDEDSNYVITTCMAVVQRQQEGNIGWAWVQAPNNGGLMFEDIDMPTMLQIVWKVLESSVMGFSGALQGLLPKEAGAGQ